MTNRFLQKGIWMMLLAAIPFVSIHSQTNYDDYAFSDKSRVYFEDFDVPNSEWEGFTKGVSIGKIHDGIFEWTSMNDQAQIVSKELDAMDWNKDWEIEIRMKHITGKIDYPHDLLFHFQDNAIYHFGFTAEGKYVFYRDINEEFRMIIPFTSSPSINKDSFNKLTVRKIGPQYLFYINENLVAKENGSVDSNNRVGVLVSPNSTIQVDYLQVSYLNDQRITPQYSKAVVPNDNISNLLVGTWYGGEAGDAPGHFIFDRERTVTYIIKGDTTGGKNYYQGSVKIDMKYEIIEDSSPKGLDLIFYSSGTDYGRIRGIIRMIDDDEFEMKLANDMGDSRPTEMKNESDNKITVFKRVK